MRAAVVAEGWAADVEEAQRLLASGDVALEPANQHEAVVPMASAIGPTAPVFVVADREGGTRAYAPVNQGPGEVAWFGRDTDAAVDRLRFLRDVAGPVLTRVLSSAGPMDILNLAAQGVAMGDDLHMRTQAATNLLVRTWLPQLAELPDQQRGGMARFLSGNHLFFLTLAMAAAKALTLWAEEVSGSSIITTMSRNGTTFGIKLAGSPEWHITAAPPITDALYYSGYGPEDAAPDIGDSAVLELVGLGGPAAAGSPAVAAFLGGSMADGRRATEAIGRYASAPAAASRCLHWTSAARRSAWTCGGWWSWGSPRRSPPASCTAPRASDRSVPGWPPRRWSVSPRRWPPWTLVWCGEGARRRPRGSEGARRSRRGPGGRGLLAGCLLAVSGRTGRGDIRVGASRSAEPAVPGVTGTAAGRCGVDGRFPPFGARMGGGIRCTDLGGRAAPAPDSCAALRCRNA